MQLLHLLAKILDLITDLSLKIVGIYLFFIKREFVNGAILFGASGVYSISMFLGAFAAMTKEATKGAIKEAVDQIAKEETK